MKCIFKINDEPIMEIITGDKFNVRVFDKLAARFILPPSEYSINGFTHRLQYLTGVNQPLEVLIHNIKENGLQCDFQRNLELEIRETK